jgi:hypothetical protein
LPIVFAALLITPHRQWLRGPHPYVACAIFVLLISTLIPVAILTGVQLARLAGRWRCAVWKCGGGVAVCGEISRSRTAEPHS